MRSWRSCGGVVDLDAVASGLLGVVHRDVGLDEQLARRSVGAAAEQGDADARGDAARWPAAAGQSAPPRAARSSRFSATSRASLLVGPGEDHRELVAAEPRDRCRCRAAGCGRSSPARGDQLVADRVAERVVDVLEVVEVDRQHRATASRSGPRRASSRSSSCSKRRRLNMPVSASWSARYWSWPSKRLRSVMSWTWARRWLAAPPPAADHRHTEIDGTGWPAACM